MALTSQTKRRLIYGGNTALVVGIMAGILIAVNFLASEYTKRFDLTDNSLFSISGQTEKVIDGLSGEVKIDAFLPDRFSAGLNFDQSKRIEFLTDLLNEYDQMSDLISVEYVDVDKEPTKARSAGVQAIPAIMVSTNDSSDILYGYGVDEQEITSKIVNLNTDEKSKIAFIVNKRGREREVDLRALNGVLEGYGYELTDVDLVNASSLGDYSAVIVSGANIPFNESEAFVLDKYIYEGGKILFALDPLTNSGLEPLLNSYGITFDDDIILDTKNHYFNPFAGGNRLDWPIINTFTDSIIVKNFNNVILPQARSLSFDEKFTTEDYELDEFMKTSINSWAEFDLNSGKAEFTEGEDKKGPFTVGASLIGSFDSFFENVDVNALAEATENDIDTELPEDNESLLTRGEQGKTRMILFGDSDFMSDQYIRSANNGDLIINSINWLLEDEDLITIQPKEAEARIIDTMSKEKQTFVFWVNIVTIPLLVLLFGLMRLIWVNYQRKKI